MVVRKVFEEQSEQQWNCFEQNSFHLLEEDMDM
jgi:hypothetical protein